MRTNEGTLDRTLRIALGFAMLALAFTGHAWLALLALLPLLTGIFGYCPVYRLFGIRTCAA